MHTILSFSLNLDGVIRIHNAVQCLAKFSDTVSLEARSDRVSCSLIDASNHCCTDLYSLRKLTMSTLNSSKSAYASFALDSDTFFETYRYNDARLSDQSQEGPSRFTCQLYNKVDSQACIQAPMLILW